MVSAISVEELLDTFDVRATLDGMAARLAAANATESDVESLKEIQQRTRAAAEQGADLFDLNLEFHKALRECAGNQVLAGFLMQIETAVQRVGTATFGATGRGLEAVEEHDRIVAAIAVGDSAAAEREAFQHMKRARAERFHHLIR